MAILIKTDGTMQVVSPKAKVFSLEELQTFVGGSIEIVYPQLDGIVTFEQGDSTVVYEFTEATLLVCNEEGMINNLPVNRLASALYPQAGGYMVHGDVLFAVVDEEVD